MKAVRHIVAERSGYIPPFVIYGPFGTGKTETIAQASLVLLKENPDARILICAQSNSAADLYITKHLDTFFKKSHSPPALRRVYQPERRVNTVSPEVRKYCLLSADEMCFEMPTREDICRHRLVIVTLATSIHLNILGLDGYFTHIFIDEAAQALETEVLMPLSLATNKTCIVLAGDHMQISPKVYCEEARNQNFHHSLVERLFNYYNSYSTILAQINPINILLSINYRTKMEILRFISSIFYGGPDQLQSHSNLPSVLGITPLQFYSVQGCEVQEPDGVSYYNTSEVQEIVERVEQLYTTWPQEWGQRSARDIGVVTPYYEQVQFIRKALRKKHPELRAVTVERVNNVQGKEFRALFICTVRSRHLVESTVTGRIACECDGESGDFGFLSDSKLLNTALTRAQSFVAVVGDPVALCAVGECVTVWRTYLKHCQNMKSLHPSSLTLDVIKQHVTQLLNSPAREKLSQIAKQAKKPMPTPQPTRSEPNLPTASSSSASHAWKTASSLPMASKSNIEIPQKTQIPNGQERSLPFDLILGLDTDKIMEDLAAELIRMEKMSERLAKEGNRSAYLDSTMKVSVDKENIEIREDDGHAVLHYDKNSQKEKSPIGANSSRSSGLLDETHPDAVEFNMMRMNELLFETPDIYKKCIIHIESSSRMYAQVIASTADFKEIVISNRSFCGKAFDKDEVVVKIVNSEIATSETPIYGQVVGVLKRFIDPSNRLFVCMAEPQTTGMMIPINRGIQKIYNLTSKSKLKRARKGHVCVYRYTEKEGVRFNRYEKVDPSNPSGKLFIVRYLKWECHMVFPIGVVVGVLPAGMDLDTGMQILEIEYNISRSFQMEEPKFPPDFQLPHEVYQNRWDIRDKWTFTIDSAVSEDLSNALSIEEVEGGNYLVGVHVTDVGYFVEKESPVDMEAQRRGASHYPLNHEAVHMLPRRISTDLCSLKTGTDRLTISLFMTVTKSGEIVGAEPRKCVMSSKQKFTLQEAEAVIHDSNSESDYFKSCILVLYQIASVWRRQRLGNAHLYNDMDIEEKLTPAAVLMIREITLMANCKIAEVLVGKFPLCVPLLCQNPPNDVALDEWKVKYASDAVNSIALTKPFLEGLSTCNCKVACGCIGKFMRVAKLTPKVEFDVYSIQWNDVVQMTKSNDMSFVQNFIVAADSHPQISVALLNWHAIQNRCEYQCSGDTDQDSQGYYTMNVLHFVHFTNPLQRYVDIVVQRLVSDFLESKSPSYISQDIMRICRQQTSLTLQATQFKDAVRMLHLSSVLRNRPLILYPIIEKAGTDGVHLSFPSLPALSASSKDIDLSLLQFSEEPVVDVEEQSIDIKWQKRIYDLSQSDRACEQRSIAVLNPEQYTLKMPSLKWQLLLKAVREESMEKLETAVFSAQESIQDPSCSSSFAVEVSSERKRAGTFDHYAQFSRKFQPCTVLKMQISAKLIKGIVTPHLQLLNLTPKLDICLEHRSDPVSCFANIQEPIATNYDSEEEYVKAWKAVVSMETAKQTVCSGNPVTIHNLQVNWQLETTIKAYLAKFTVPVSFLKERQMKSFYHISFDELFELKNHDICQNFFSDYLCLRYSDITLADDPALNESIALIVNNNVPFHWIGHCVITEVFRIDNQLQITAKLQQSNVPLPEILLSSCRTACTVEWICKPESLRNLEKALHSLNNGCQLARDIAVGRKPVTIVDYKDVDHLRKQPVPKIPAYSPSQEQAIQVALKQPFSVICGPAGSGKSLLSACLAYLLVQRNINMQGSLRGQVLICGPSEKTLDVIGGYLMNIGEKCPKIVRVYSKEVELQEFPIPLEPVPKLKQKARLVHNVDLRMEPICLHNMIREPSNELSQSITEFDMLFRMYPDQIPDDQLVEYMKIVDTAERVELSKAEVVLCTCRTSASPKVAKNANVQQIIIDDCNRCSEPESMIPISLYKNTMQVVLIGDPCQLKPSVMEQRAHDSGLGRSLVDRYGETAVLLETQFRMHEGIADFPSTQFYNRKLVCSTVEQSRPSPMKFWPTNNKPIVFCHIEGTEENIPMVSNGVATHSKTNPQEVEIACTAAALLVKRHGVKGKDIALISPYSAHNEALQQKLIKRSMKNIGVHTVEDCQGQEWDYAIFSAVRTCPMLQVDKHPTHGWKSRVLGDLADGHLINVVLTRAKKGMIIIGNKNLLESDCVWNALLTKYAQEGQIVPATDFLRRMTS